MSLRLDQIVADIRRNGGITLNVTTGKPRTTGWAVSPYKDREEKFQALTINRLASYLSRHGVLLAQPHHYLGAWFNEEDGFTYLDVSVVVSTPADALEVATKHDQLAVFHLDTCTTIPTPELRRKLA